MSSLLRSVLFSALLLSIFPSLPAAQCAEGDEACLHNDDAGSSAKEQRVNSTGKVTTETFSDEQAELVTQITRNLKRRRLTRPAGDNAFEQIQRLKKIHPLHDYSVNGNRYIARIFMVLGRRALRKGDTTLANLRLQKAREFDPQVERQAELKQGIANAGGTAGANLQSPVGEESTRQDAATGVVATDSADYKEAAQNESAQDDSAHKGQSERVENTAVQEQVTFTGKVTTETYTDDQAELVTDITRDLKQRRLIEPAGNNAHEKILLLKEMHPAHDYSVNGMKYIARILIRQGRQALAQGNLELASRHMLKAIQFDPEVKRQDELKKAIVEAARDRETKREIKALTEETTTVTGYLPSDQSELVQPRTTTDIKFVAPVMVAIPAGNFVMGNNAGSEDERPEHYVELEAFSMSKHEITMQQYRVFALATGRLVPQYSPQQSNLPVTNVSWHDAVGYTEWLSQRTQRLFRLPTESEWEYSARAGTTSKYFTGDTLVDAANCVGCGGAWDSKSVAPVGSFAPNEFGLYDMHGNVWEWVQDCWSDNYAGRSNRSVDVEIDGCKRHVLRGGSWYNNAEYASASYRGNETAYFRDDTVGFRVVHEGL